jgi:hypothetical protein
VIENHLISIGIFARQSPPVDISVLIQKTPFIDLRRKEINGLLEKGVFIVVIEKDICKASVYSTYALLMKLSTLVLIKPLKS